MLDEDLVDLIDKIGIDEVKVRTPLTVTLAMVFVRGVMVVTSRGTMVNGRGSRSYRRPVD